MSSYFKLWKGMMGVATLVMACGFMVGWVRSLNLGEMAVIPTGTHWANFVGSTSGLIFVGESYWAKPRTEPYWQQFRTSENPLNQPNCEWSLHLCGFGVYQSTEPRSWHVVRILTVPYWSIVCPLTLLSAWRLLSKPRVAKPNTLADTVRETLV